MTLHIFSIHTFSIPENDHTIKNWHEKTPEAAWLPGFHDLHLLRQHNMVRETEMISACAQAERDSRRQGGAMNPLSRRQSADTLKECLDGNAIILQAKTAFFPAAV